MKHRLVTAALLLMSSGLLRAQEPSIAWEPDYDKTLEAAKADNMPIMIAFIMDGELANEEVVKKHFHEKEIVAASKGFHCLVASIGVHAATSAEGVCPRFGCNTCASHQRISMRAQTDLLQSTRVSAPQFLFLRPDGETVLVRHVWILTPEELLKKMRLALSFSASSTGTDAEKLQREEVTRALEQANDKNASVRASALERLAELDDPRIIEFLVKQTGENVEDVRRVEAIRAMGKRGNAKVLPVLIKLLTSRLPRIRNNSAIAIERLGMLEASEPVRAALKSEINAHIRGNLVRTLAACDAQAPENVKIIIAMIENGTPKERVAAVRASFDMTLSDALQKALLTAARNTSVPIIRGAAFCALAHHQVAEGVAVIEKALPHETIPDMKSMAQSSLAVLKGTGYDGPSALQILERYLPDEMLRN
jgi:HEAT repeat protein